MALSYKRWATFGVASSLFLFSSSHVLAAGFGLAEHSASGLGSAFSGASVDSEDASVVWFNPANMTDLEGTTNVSGALHVVVPRIKYEDTGSAINPLLVGGNTQAAEAVMKGQKNIISDKVGAVPNGYVTRRINDKTVVGVGVNVPFGLEFDYEDDWFGRYNAVDSRLETININPSVAYQVNDKLSIGGGVSIQSLKVELETAVDSAGACYGAVNEVRRRAAQTTNAATKAQLEATANNLQTGCATTFGQDFANPSRDSKAVVTGDDISYGFNLGLSYKPTKKTKLGVSYRSRVKHEVEGDANYDYTQELTNVAGAVLPQTGAAKASTTLPATLSISASHKLNNKVTLKGDITRTEWSTFDQLSVTRADNGDTVSHVDEDWQDVNRYSVGMDYKYNDRLTLRTGVALDETPVPREANRTPRTPGADRTWVAVGANYKLKKDMSVDVGYTHIRLDEAKMRVVSNETSYITQGTYDTNIDVLSAQFNWRF